MLILCWIATIILAGCAVGCLVAAVREMFGFYGDWMGVMLYLFGSVLLGALAITPLSIYRWETSPGFELKKSEWDCTSSHRQTTTSMVMSGKVMVPVTTTTDVCDRYDRRR